MLADSASSVGLLIAFYYGLTGFACAWFFRRELLASPRALLFKGILPALGGLALLAAFAASIKSYWPATSSYSSFAGIGGIFLIGAGSLRLWRARSAPAADWKKAKGLASVGLTAGLVQWYFAFMTVGGEWFLMWQSRIWNGQDAAFRLFTFMGLTLLFLNQSDD